MTTSPERNGDLLQFAQQHLPRWRQNAASLGIGSVQLDRYQETIQSAEAIAQRVVAVKAELNQLYVAQRDAFERLRTVNGALVKTIRATAQQDAEGSAPTQDSRVLILADLPMIARRSPTRPPQAPRDLRATLDLTGGGVTVSWKCDQLGKSGVVYRLERSTLEDETWTPVTLTGDKHATDTAIPAGSAVVTYRVTALRGSGAATSTETLFVRWSGEGEKKATSGERPPRATRQDARRAA